MSTNARIGILEPNGKVRSVYVHWDGYLDGVGYDLVRKHNTPEDAKALIDLGDLSTVCGGVEAYHRDKKEAWDGVMPKVTTDEVTYGYKYGGGDLYLYLYKDEAWHLLTDGAWAKIELPDAERAAQMQAVEETARNCKREPKPHPDEYLPVPPLPADFFESAPVVPTTPRKMRIIGAPATNVIRVEVPSLTDNEKTYDTFVNVVTGECRCNCGSHEHRVAEAAKLLRAMPNAKGDISCKHARLVHQTFCD